MDTRKIGAPTRKELRAMIAERMARKDTDGNALYLLRRGLRSLELFATPDTVGGDLAMDICAAIDEIERIAKLEEALENVMRYCVTPNGFPDAGKGRTQEQQAAFDQARALLQTPKP